MGLISLKSDYAFKELFSHEDVRKQFLSDVLGIPVEKIKSAELAGTHLRVSRRRQKQGILDVVIRLENGTMVDVEMQVRRRSHWTKRQLFYLAKMYTDHLKVGEDYGKLCRCVSIAVVDFKLSESAEYHREYRLRDKSGEELTDLLEVHIIELGKALQGKAVDDWIRLFNAEKEEDLAMISADNVGIREAVEVLREMSLGKSLRAWYERNLKLRRDRKAEDDYVRECGRAEGKTEGIAESILLLLRDLGDVPEELRERILAETDPDILGRWLKIAARAESIRQFEAAAGKR